MIGDRRPFEDDPLDTLDEAESVQADLGLGDTADTSDRDRAEEWSAVRAFDALTAVAATVSSNLEFSSLVREILDTAIETVGAGRGVLLLARKDADSLVPVAARDVSRSDLADLETISRTVLQLARRGEAVVSDDTRLEPRLRDVPSVRLSRVRSLVCAPLVFRGRTTGILYVDNDRARAFPAHARRFLEAFASLAAVALENARLLGDLRHDNALLKQKVGSLDAFGRIATVSPEMIAVLQQAAVAATTDMPVMLLGESGTGKELIAKSIHESSPRALRAFQSYNCAAIPEELMESIFFGHVKGAFSGAHRNAPGLFRLADKGVLFLDEVAELSGPLQAKLLRVIEEGVVRPVGSDEQHPADVRLITATSRDLRAAVREGRFREDLFYRMDVLEIDIPPLRARTGDVPTLIAHFCSKHAGLARSAAPVFTPEAIAFLERQSWRGNVRELENFIQRVLVMSNRTRIDVDDAREFLTTLDEPDTGKATPVAGPEIEPLSTRERETIVQALRRAGGNKSKAARMLGIHRNSLARRIEKLGIEWTD